MHLEMIEKWKEQLMQMGGPAETTEKVDGGAEVKKKDGGRAKEALVIGPRNQKRKRTCKCDFRRCDASYTTNYALRRHIESVHYKIKNFICHHPGCRRAFHLEAHYLEHSYIHTGEEPF
jgi:hypothetical protein